MKKIFREIFLRKYLKKFNNSEEYWNKRYYWGGNSGPGSYNEEAKIKANFINKLIIQKNIKNIIDIGCGDGNNTKLFKNINYIGFDVSPYIINQNRKLFKTDSRKKFFVLDDSFQKKIEELKSKIDTSETITLSLDVIFHLIEESIFLNHINNLNLISTGHLAIISSNCNEEYNPDIPHVKHRNFINFLDQKKWLLTEKTSLKMRDFREIYYFSHI
tara:strand:- start:20 stop:667 length:648 start_codon:yes stop_codon:yes gene_type:complete